MVKVALQNITKALYRDYKRLVERLQRLCNIL